MELMYAHQVGFNQIRKEKFDFFITASGYEVRSTYLMNNVEIDAGKKIFIGFHEKKGVHERKKNDEAFRLAGFENIEISYSEGGRVYRIIDDLCKSTDKNNLRFLIDYSCMSKTWYASMIKYFIDNESIGKNFEIFFSYSPAVFSEPRKGRKRKYLSPPSGLLKPNKSPVKPVALVLGLGYEKMLGESFLNKIKYDSLYVFYSNPAFDNRYVAKIMENNEQILKKISPEKIFTYPVEDLKKTDSVLTSLCLELRLSHHIALLSVGPKPFTLSCLLLAARYPDIEVWDVKTEKEVAVYERFPSGEPLVCKAVFSNDENEFL